MKTVKNISGPFESEHPTRSLMDKSYLLQISRHEEMSAKTSETSFALDHVSVILGDDYDHGHVHFKHDSSWGLFLKGYFYFDISENLDSEENISLLFKLLHQRGPKKAMEMIQGGMYNLYLWDRRTKEVYLHNDRLGLSSQFYYENDHYTRFSDNQFNFRSQRSLSELSVVEFLKFGYLPSSDSLFTGIFRAPAFSSGLIRGFGQPLVWRRLSNPYPAPDEHLSVSRENLVAKWSSAFARYFSRLEGENVSMGLSGGYDSRLLAAFTGNKRMQAIHFGHPSNPETQIAKQVANQLDLKFMDQSFPHDMVANFGPHLGRDLHTLTSIENAHVMHLSQTVQQLESAFYLDGFLGGAILADAYVPKPQGNPLKKIWKFISGDHFLTNKGVQKIYADSLYLQDKQALSDDELEGVLSTEHRAELIGRFHRLVADHWNDAPTHEDLVERISLITRGRFLIANGPSAISQHTQVLLPFMDNDILDLSMQTPKAWRFSHGFYNDLWRSIFPALGNIRKAGTFGRAADSDRIYRLKTLLFKLAHKFRKVNTLASAQKEEHYFSLEAFLKEEKTSKQIDQILGSIPETLPLNIHHLIRQKVSNGSADPRLILRYITLFHTLETNNA